MTASRFQHSVMAFAVLVVAIIVAWLSFTEEPAEAFLFPRLIAMFFVVLAVWNFGRAALGLARVGEGMTLAQAGNKLPGLLVAGALVFYGAKFLGFYTSATLAMLAITTLYDPAPYWSPSAWLKRIVITLGFMAVIYGLFALLLQVQTPRGLYF